MPDMRFFRAPEPEANPYWTRFQTEPANVAFEMQCWFLMERLRVYVNGPRQFFHSPASHVLPDCCLPPCVAALEHIAHGRESIILDFSIWSDVIFATKHYEGE
jgi:hypothetical protein